MSVHFDRKRGTYTVQVWYRVNGERKKKTKRGFKTKKEARAWEIDFLASLHDSLTMTLEAFVRIYQNDIRPRLRMNTWLTKESIIRKWIIPYFGNMRVCDITPADIVRWENWLLSSGLAGTTIRTVENQLSSLLNHAQRFYGLPSNPMLIAGRVGSKRPDKEMSFWTKGEYLRASEVFADKPLIFIAFELLYWLGIREGELLALAPQDFDFDRSLLHIRRSYQRLRGEDVITAPKTKKSVRDIMMPAFVSEEVQDYLFTQPDLMPDERIFKMTKHTLSHEMKRASEQAGVKRIRIHDLRHSHVSLLIEMGFSPLAIADRLGHESTEITMAYAHLFPSVQADLADALNRIGGTDEP